MKGIPFILIICFVVFNGCKTSKPVAQVSSGTVTQTGSSTTDAHQDVNYSEQSTWLLGYFNQGQLKSEPHSVWFYKGYDEYRTNPESG
jgi:hypothetical protein